MKYIINTKGEVIFRAEDTGYFANGQGLCPVQVNGKWGYINTTGNMVIPCVYEDVWPFKNECAIVKQGGKYGLINKRGEILVPCVKSDDDYVPLPHDGVICIYIENLEETKCIDVSGNHLFTISGRVGDFSEGVATITSYKEEGKYSIGVINKSGEYIIPEGIYSHISAFHYGVAQVISETTGKTGYINHQGEYVVPIKYDGIYWGAYPSPIACAIIGDKYGYVDVRNGKELYPIILDKKSIDTHYPDTYTDNMFIFSIGEDIYIYNLDNCKLFKSSKYKEIYCYCDGLCCVSDKNSGKIGFIDKEGKLAIPCVFDEPFYVYQFHGNICAMSNHIIDKQGKVIRKIPHGHQICYCGRHDQRRDYYIELYSTGTQADIIDVKGKTIFSGFCVDDLSEFPIPVQDSVTRKWGYVDRNGKLVIPYQFNESYLFHDGFATLDEPITKKTSQRTSSSKTQTTYHTSTKQKPSSSNSNNSNQGCYIATAVYGSYDCPEVWTLRRYRDNVLDHTWYGKLFIRIYYSISPTLVRWFGTTHWFRELFYKPLNNWVARLNKQGFKNTPYRDKY